MLIDKHTRSLQNITFADGHLLLINKDKLWTSFDVVNKLRFMIRKAGNYKKIKVGHGGTLDPLATGLLLVGVGKETKNLQDYQNHIKEYIADVHFGMETPSYDSETEPIAFYETAHITKKAIQDVLQEQFTGKILQKPPVYSAKTISGVRAYKSAREGKQVEMVPVPVEVYEHELLSFENNIARIRFVCSKGTYIRSLAYDIGKSLQSGAYLSDLIRTKSGGFSVDNSICVGEFEKLLQLSNTIV